jgi:hypothetical protein
VCIGSARSACSALRGDVCVRWQSLQLTAAAIISSRGDAMNARARTYVAVLLSAIGCGDAAPPEQPQTASSAGGEPAGFQRRGEGMKVEGILGTIPQLRIEEVLEGKLPEFQRCFFEGSSQIASLGGHMKFYFHVGLDGRVEWVHPRGSSIGHRATELCLLSRARSARFPAPKGGGPAEFVWGFELEPADGPSTPQTLSAERVLPVVDQHRPELSACGVDALGHYVVTAYIAPDGSTEAVGAAADSNEAAERIDCILETIRSWPLTEPGAGSATKVSFHL